MVDSACPKKVTKNDWFIFGNFVLLHILGINYPGACTSAIGRMEGRVTPAVPEVIEYLLYHQESTEVY